MCFAGKVPFIKCGQFVIAQLESIIEFVQSKVIVYIHLMKLSKKVIIIEDSEC